MDVPRDGRTLAVMVHEHIGSSSTVITDKHASYKSLEKRGYDHRTVNRGDGEYASGERNEIHANNC